MMQYVQDYFTAHPDVEKAYETPDMVLHPSEDAAKNWVHNKWPNHIVTHENPAFEPEDAIANAAAPQGGEGGQAPAEGDPGDEQQ